MPRQKAYNTSSTFPRIPGTTRIPRAATRFAIYAEIPPQIKILILHPVKMTARRGKYVSWKGIID
ncbi:MAG: hypothetical protein U9R36_00890 [Elusimicrobiota bacterium]|nr:hypothetical protein [Elusimicrobiota bacterium]